MNEVVHGATYLPNTGENSYGSNMITTLFQEENVHNVGTEKDLMNAFIFLYYLCLTTPSGLEVEFRGRFRACPVGS